MDNEAPIQFARYHEFVAYQQITPPPEETTYNQTHDKQWSTESYTSSSSGVQPSTSASNSSQ